MDNLPRKIAKRIAGTCLYSGCAEHALEDSDFCAPHDAHERGRAAAKQRRRRKRRAKLGLCVAGCGRRVPKKRGRKGRECRACQRAHRERMRIAREKRCVPGDSGAVPGGNWRPDYDPETGAEWQRYRGKGRRGRLTTEQQIDEDKRNAEFAIQELQRFLRGADELKHPDVLELPRIQREALRRTAGAPLAHAGRFIDELAERYGT